MRYISTSPYEVARRFIGTKEVPGKGNNPAIVSMLQLDASWAGEDSIPWCSAFANYVCHLLNVPRSMKLNARSWLTVGTPIELIDAEPGLDVVVFQRGLGKQPGPDVLDAPGHIAFFSSLDADGMHVWVVGGNQGDAVTLAKFSRLQVLGVRRLA